MAVATISFDQLDGWLKNLVDVAVKTNFVPAWKRINVLLSASMKKNFAGQHEPEGDPWKPIKQYRARGGEGKLRQGQALRDRGLLMASATGRGPNAITKEAPQRFEWGSNLKYAHVHQDGMTIRPKKGKALAIPLTREAYRVGSPLQFPRPLHVVWPAGRRSGWLVESKPGATGGKSGKGKSKGRGAKDILHYKLAPKVTIPARPFMGVNPPLLEDIGRVVIETVVKGMKGP